MMDPAAVVPGERLSLEYRIQKAMMEAFPGAVPAFVSKFARTNAGSTSAKLQRELSSFIQDIPLPLPPIPQVPPNGWKFHVRAPLRTFNEDDLAEQHMCAAEAAVLASMRPAEARGYTIDMVENEELRRNFLAMKHKIATDGEDPAELLLLHGTQDSNLDPILSGNFDPSCIRRVAFGRGFYFSEYPSTSLQYGRSLILCRVLPGKTQTEGTLFDPTKFDSFQVPEGQEYAEGAASNIHVVRHRDQILPLCVVHVRMSDDDPAPAHTLKPTSAKYTLRRITDFGSFDADDAVQLSARAVLGRLLRMNRQPERFFNRYGPRTTYNSNLQNANLSQRLASVRASLGQYRTATAAALGAQSTTAAAAAPAPPAPAPARPASGAAPIRWSRVNRGHVMSSVVYVESEEAANAFTAKKCQLAEERIDTKEVLLFHHANVWGPGFFSKGEFADTDLIRTEEFGGGLMLTNWLDLDYPHASIVIVYRVLLGKMQTEGDMLDSFMYSSLRMRRKAKSKEADSYKYLGQFTYVVGNEFQVLPYCVAVIKNVESRRAIVTSIMQKVGPHLAYGDSSSSSPKPADLEPSCLVCARVDLDLMEWFGCASACALCADFFRRVCIGSGHFFGRPQDCSDKYKCVDVLKCRACRLFGCLESGMTGGALAAHFNLPAIHWVDIENQLSSFRAMARTLATPAADNESDGKSDDPA